jgi:hypothetical protein
MPTVFGTNSQTFPSNGTFTVPAGITEIVVECWGGGGSGGKAVGVFGGTKKAAGGGGGGGAYARKTISTSGGTTYSVNVAAAQTISGTAGNSSWFGSSSTVLAVGGGGGGNQTEQSGADTLGEPGFGGRDIDCIGDVTNSGGDGSGFSADPKFSNCGYGTYSGAGGGGAGNVADGTDAICPGVQCNNAIPPVCSQTSLPNRGLGGEAYGGNGANGVTTGNVGNSGVTYGGGGSGGHTRDITVGQRQGGAGARGQVVVWWTPSTPPPVTQTVCTECTTIDVGCYMYIGNTENPAPDGYYSNGIDCYTVSGGAGYVTAVDLKVRIDWDVREGTGSGAIELIIKNVDGLPVVTQESGAFPVNGTVYIPQSKTPYFITVNVLAGTDVGGYRICNISNGTQIELNTAVLVTSTYTVNPTPLWSSVYATYNDMPTACPV